MTERSERKRADGMVGLALIGGYAAGILALLTGLFAAVSGEIVGAGVCFLAAGVAFGLPVNALLRD
jgi:hypothetical protein